MRAIAFRAPFELRCETVADPRIERDTDVLLKIELSAICGSDLHVYRGVESGLDAGTVMGHEFLGTVVEAGPAVRRFTRGMRVVSPFSTTCGRCFFCERGLPSRCTAGELFGWVQQGRGLQGGQAEYVRVPWADTTLVEVPPRVPAEQALLVG